MPQIGQKQVYNIQRNALTSLVPFAVQLQKLDYRHVSALC